MGVVTIFLKWKLLFLVYHYIVVSSRPQSCYHNNLRLYEIQNRCSPVNNIHGVLMNTIDWLGLNIKGTNGISQRHKYLRDDAVKWISFSLMFYYFFPMASVYLMEGRTSYLFESWCLRCITMHMFFMGNKVAFTLVILGLMEFNVDFSWFWTCIVSTKQLVNRRVQATGWNWFFGEIMEHLRATLETGRETLR